MIIKTNQQHSHNEAHVAKKHIQRLNQEIKELIQATARLEAQLAVMTKQET